MGRYIYVLKYYRKFPDPNWGINCWGMNGRWPRPNGGMWKCFANRQAAQDFLNHQYHVKKRREVFIKWRPKRIRISKDDFTYLQKNGLILNEQ